MPAYNGEKYIEQAIYSVLNQPCKDLIVVVVNDGSKDNTQSIVEKIASKDNRLVLLNQTNKGVSAARNKALDYCSSDINPKYIAFLDSDDVWIKDFYTEDTRRLLLDNNKDLYKFEYFNGDQNLKRARLEKITVEDDAIDPFDPSFCSYIYSNDIMKKYNIGFPEGISAQEDVAFKFIFYSLSDSFKSIRRPIFVYRSNISSVCHKKFDPSDRYFNDVIPAWEFVADKIEENQGREKNIMQAKTMIKTYLVEYIEAALERGTKKEEINDKLSQYANINDLNDDSIWLAPKHKKLYSEYVENPNKLRIKLRIRHIAVSVLRKFRSLPFVVKKRYPIDIANIV